MLLAAPCLRDGTALALLLRMLSLSPNHIGLMIVGLWSQVILLH